MGNEEVIDRIKPYLYPWNVNSLAQEAGKYILSNYQQLLPDSKQLVSESLYLQDHLNQMDKVEVSPSNCNFILAKLLNGNASDLKEYLLKQYSFLIRDASNFRGLGEQYFRIAAQTNHDFNQQLVEGIRNWIGKQ